MKKFALIISIFMLLSIQNVQAKTIKVESLEPLSTMNPCPTLKIKTLEPEYLFDKTYLPPDTIISGIILKVNGPKRGKRNGYIEFIPTDYTYKGHTSPIIDSQITAKIIAYEPLDPQKLTINTTKKVANYFLKGLISVGDFVIGAAEAKEGQRIKSGAIRVYQNSFLTYIEPGKELNIKTGDTLILKLKKNN